MASEPTARILPWPHGRRRAAEREFLPAALEVIETPASPIGRAVALAIIGFLCIALAWAWLGRVDIIATAEGRLVPSGKTKIVQPLEAGIVRAIHVHEGDRVRQGDLLVELDGTVATAERDKAAHDFMAERLDVARLVALKGAIDGDAAASMFMPPRGASAYDAERTRAAVLAQEVEQASKIAALDKQIDQKSAEGAEIAATIGKLNATMPLLKEKEARRKLLLQQEYGNRFAWLDAEQQLLEAQHDLIVQGERAAETQAARAALERQREQTHAEYAHKVLGDLADAEQKLGEAAQDYAKAEEKSLETRLLAPIDGVVQQLAVHTLGGVVTPAEQLLVIVPEDATLIAEAMVTNSDVGFVHEGQEVEVKIETFTFTRYGFVHGRVIGISPDIVTEDKRDPNQSQDTSDKNDKNGTQSSGSPSYMARVALDRTSMMIEGRERQLGPGMAVTCEIKTGRRRILDFLLSPLRRYAQEAFRER